MVDFFKKFSKKGESITSIFTFTFLQARETSLKPGKKVHLKWKRGEKKENHGNTDDFEVSEGGNIKFNKSASFKTTILKEGEKYESKFLSISLKQVCFKSTFKIDMK